MELTEVKDNILEEKIAKCAAIEKMLDDLY